MKKKQQEIGQSRMLDFKKIAAIMRKNLIVMTRDRTRLIPLVLMPVIMILVFGYISGNTPKHISAAIITYDHSPLSEQIQQEIQNSQVFAVRHVVSTEGEGKKLLDAGEVNILIEIPPHLQEDIEHGIQTSIIVIVDESDSSIGMTSKQTMNAIVNRVSYAISLEKIRQQQKAVGEAAAQLMSSAAPQPNFYESIAATTGAASGYMKESRAMTDTYADYLFAASPDPVLILASRDNVNVTSNNTYLFDTLAAAGTKATIAVMQASSAYAGAAQHQTVFAQSLAEQGSKQIQETYDHYVENVVAPVQQINVFVYSRAEEMIKPLVYEEKPAYGTGKRPVDFLIPAIIALTIFQGAVMGMGRAVAGEKREGSLTRVFLTPTSNTTIISGTLGFYVIFETFRAAFIIAVAMVLFSIKIEGSLVLIGLILTVYAAISTSIGMILSSMVKTEQQYMAMAMLVGMPTIFLSGAFFPIQAMPKFMQVLAQFLPVTYGGQALRMVMIKGFSFDMILIPFIILLLFLIASLVLVFMVYKRDIE